LNLHFLSRERKRKQKKPPVSRFFLRVIEGSERVGTRFAQTADTLFAAPSTMLGAGQREA
jgi:hypothetical protein